MLDSLHIQNFRLFDSLVIETLARINLIVGLNNSGKSCLLEALFLYGSEAQPTALYQMVENRGEDWELRFLERGILVDPADHPFRVFFPGYQFPTSAKTRIVVGSQADSTNRVTLHLDEPEAKAGVVSDLYLMRYKGTAPLEGISLEKEVELLSRVGTTSVTGLAKRHNKNAGSVQFVPSKPRPAWETYPLWDHVNLNPDLREQLFEAMRIVDPNLQEIVMIGQGRRMTPMVLYKHGGAKVPLPSLGDGMNHLFQIVLALVNAAGGMLFIDEFENGLHYSVQPKVWKLIFEMAHRLDIQVFATTHGWDCIEAFQQAAKASEEEAMLFRMGRSRRKSQEGQITVQAYSKEDLLLASKNSLDVR